MKLGADTEPTLRVSVFMHDLERAGWRPHTLSSWARDGIVLRLPLLEAILHRYDDEVALSLINDAQSQTDLDLIADQLRVARSSHV